MTREELIHAARDDLRAADSIGANYDYRTMRYAGAIAKLLLAQVTADPNYVPLDQLRDASASRLGPRISDASEWLPGDTP